MNRRDVHFPAKTVRRKRASQSHGRDLVNSLDRRYPKHRHHGHWIRHTHRRDVEAPADTAQTTAIATLPTAELVLPKEFTTLVPRGGINPADNAVADDVLEISTPSSLSLPTIAANLTSALQNATGSLPPVTLGATASSNLTSLIPSPTTTLTGGTTEAATPLPLLTTNTLLSQVATGSNVGVVTAASTLGQGGTNISATALSETFSQSTNFPSVTPLQNTTASTSETNSGPPREDIFGGFPFPFPTTGTLPTAFPTFTPPLNFTGSVTLLPTLTSTISAITSAVGNLTQTSAIVTSATNVETTTSAETATNVETSLTSSEPPTLTPTSPGPTTETSSPPSTEISATQTPSEVASSVTQETNLSASTPEPTISATGESATEPATSSFTPTGYLGETTSAGETTLPTVNPSEIISNLPSNLTTLPFPSITSIPTFFNLSSTSSYPTTSSLNLLNATRSSTTTSFTKSNTPTSAGFTWVGSTTTTGNYYPTVAGGPGTTATTSATPSSTSTSAVVPLVPAIVGSLGGVALLAALGVLLLAVRRRRTRPTSELLGSEGEGRFMTEGDFTVLSGQRLGTGVSGRTPVVYRDGESPTSRTTVTPPTAARTRAAGMSRFMEDL